MSDCQNDRTVPADAPVRVIRSARRTRTAQARWNEGVLEVRIPAWLSAREEKKTVDNLVARMLKKTAGNPATNGDEGLVARAEKLNRELLEGRGKPSRISWSDRQSTRWGSCTQSTGEIRISSRLKAVPDYVLDSVLVHELVHTFVAGGHTPEFWAWANRAPKCERANGYLEAYERWGSYSPSGLPSGPSSS